MVQARYCAESARQDAQLLCAARAGDTGSLGQLFDRYRPHLLGAAIHLLGYRADAEDAVHDTFIAALTHLHELQDPAAVGAWLHAITRNRCLMQLRSARHCAEVDDGDAILNAMPDEARVEDAIENAQLRDWVWHALSRLPEALRSVMLLRHFGSFASYAEIAAMLDLPIGTVRSRLFEGKARLAHLLLAEAAGRAPDQQALQNERQSFLFGSIDEIFTGRRCDAYFDAHADDLLIHWAGRHTTRGVQPLRDEIEGDFDAGVVMRPERVLASGDITVLEGRFINPPHDPLHCPPGLALVMQHEAGRISRLHLYLSPRPPLSEAAA